ncbi:MAG: T9SS type A sorting domain-containing protein, partial [Chitinophagales bacterium]
ASISDTIACNIVSVENPNPYSPNIQLFPNPNKGNFTLVLPLQQTETVNIEIFNAFGQVKIRRRLKNTATFEQHDFNLDLNSGLYFVRVSGENWIWTEKMVVE